ncbi:MAG: GlsB/YeaQ/YmgE family stress response membrane protein [Saprospiraceae bacterium]
MKLLIWLLIGLGAGILAKAITPEKESNGWISSMIIGMLGSILGGFIASITGLSRMIGGGMLASLIIATGGAVLVLLIYHRYFADKWNLKV